MDQQPPNENLSSYYHPQHHHHHHHHHHSPVAASPTNGLLPPSSTVASADMVYPHSAPSAAASAPVEPSKRKRGRPRKYGTPELALAAKKATASSHRERKDQQGFGGSSSPPPSSSYSGPSARKSQLSGLGNAGQGFTPHVIGIAAGEDVAQKIMLFMQQSKREICILSASGSISIASLRQPATSGGNITYEGRFEIITLSGSYVHTELGGRTGGLSICLSDTSGQIIGGGVGGPLVAAGPVQVIIGSFSVDPKKNTSTSVKGDPSGKLPSPVGGSAASSGGFRAAGINLSSPSHYMVQAGARM